MRAEKETGLFLTYSRVAPDSPFHAAAYHEAAPIGSSHPVHGQDFYEFMLVTQTGGMHLLNGLALPLKAGDLWLVRPGDTHGLLVAPGAELHFFNIAFPAVSWHTFTSLLLQPEAFEAWRQASEAPYTRLTGEQLAHLHVLARAVVEAYLTEPRALQLVRFWSAVLPYIMPEEAARKTPAAAPVWLARGVSGLESEENLRVGLPYLLRTCHVSQAHLCRCVRDSYGCSPTQLVRQKRLRLAARLLIDTKSDPLTIASRCGFENVSYFYRSFKQHFGISPRHYRLRAGSREILGE